MNINTTALRPVQPVTVRISRVHHTFTKTAGPSHRQFRLNEPMAVCNPRCAAKHATLRTAPRMGRRSADDVDQQAAAQRCRRTALVGPTVAQARLGQQAPEDGGVAYRVHLPFT